MKRYIKSNINGFTPEQQKIYDRAIAYYDADDYHGFENFTDDELEFLWGVCAENATPYAEIDAPFDDEVLDAMYGRPIYDKIFDFGDDDVSDDTVAPIGRDDNGHRYDNSLHTYNRAEATDIIQRVSNAWSRGMITNDEAIETISAIMYNTDLTKMSPYTGE